MEAFRTTLAHILPAGWRIARFSTFIGTVSLLFVPPSHAFSPNLPSEKLLGRFTPIFFPERWCCKWRMRETGLDPTSPTRHIVSCQVAPENEHAAWSVERDHKKDVTSKKLIQSNKCLSRSSEVSCAFLINLFPRDKPNFLATLSSWLYQKSLFSSGSPSPP